MRTLSQALKIIKWKNYKKKNKLFNFQNTVFTFSSFLWIPLSFSNLITFLFLIHFKQFKSVMPPDSLAYISLRTNIWLWTLRKNLEISCLNCPTSIIEWAQEGRKEGELEGIAKISPELHLCFHEEGRSLRILVLILSSIFVFPWRNKEIGIFWAWSVPWCSFLMFLVLLRVSGEGRKIFQQWRLHF
jgi:hypothetical protein